jgi:uncharacterized membrane protein YfcA
MDAFSLTWIAATFIAAGVVKGVTGMGLPTLAMALLSLRMPAPAAAALMLLPALLTNVAQCLGPHGGALLRRLWPLWTSLVAGTLLSPWAMGLQGLHDRGAQLALGVVLAAYGVVGLFKPRLPQPGRHASALGALAGLLGGALSAATGVFVLPLVPWLQALKLEREAMIQALGISFTLASLSLALRLGGLGAAALPGLGASGLALVAAFVGMALGARLRTRLAPPRFQRALFGVFLLLGLLTLAR